MIAGLLGALLAGCCYIALDPSHPIDYALQLTARCNATLTLTDKPKRLEGRGWPTPILAADDWTSRTPATPREGPTAYVIFTSGSTGQPKGVVVGRASLSNYLDWCDQALPRNGGGTPLLASPAVDLSVTSIFPPLRWGEPITLCDDVAGGRGLVDALLQGPGFSFVKLTPSHVKMLTEDERASLGCQADLIMLGGESCPPELVGQLRRDRPDVRVMNHYGPTEATVGCCVYEVPARVETDDPLPVGWPLPGVRTRIDRVDGACDGAGELLVGGACLAAGYLGDPANPAFQYDGEGARWYATGDIVQQRADGALVFIGRRDDQVKILGHRVELAAVTRALEQHPRVESAYAVVATGEHPVLLAAVTPGTCDETELHAHLSACLPRSHLPAVIVVCDTVQTTLSGKIDRGWLVGAASHGGSIEVQLRETWEALLGSVVDDRDDFFDGGGDSLAAVALIESIRQNAGVDIDVVELFEHPTFREFAEVVQAAARKAVV
jgi:amino acid adenylation domain-containing protein